LKAGAGDKLVLFKMISSSLAILTFVEKHPAFPPKFSVAWREKY